MITCEEFERELHEALTHLYDPDYQPSQALCAAIGCGTQAGVFGVQTFVLRAIESLTPPSDTPPTAHTRQVYDLLHNRFVLKLTQEETADRMHISRTSVHRAQRKAVHSLARALRERSQAQALASQVSSQEKKTQPPAEESLDTALKKARPGGAFPSRGGESMGGSGQALDWQSQVQRELASLQAKAPDRVSDVGGVIASAIEFVHPLASERGVGLEVKSLQAGLVATVHPVVLHQILISAVRRLVGHISDGRIDIYARLQDGNVRITLTGAIDGENGLREVDLAGDIPLSDDVSIKTCVDGAHAFVWIEVPSVGKVTVLVVDDNEDMVRFYKGATVGTRYHIVSINQGRGLFDALATVAPDAIVLDVMLPDIDGWRLLMRLREDPASRSIPVIVCSVVREEDLALSLGAVRYLAKPVRPREFIQALDQVLPQAAARASTSPPSNGEAC